MRTIILLVTILTATNQLKSQSEWPAPDAEWYLGHECFSPFDVDHYFVNGQFDTLNQTYTRISLERVGVLEYADTTLFITQDGEKYVRFNGDTLFWIFEGTERPLLCFNLEVGDTWNPLPLELPDPDSECTLSSMKVLDKTTVEYNGISYRQLTIGSEIPLPSETDDPQPHVVWYGVFDERTFGREQFFPEYNFCGGVVEWNCFDFRCYSDDEISIQETGNPCDFPISVSIKENFNSSPLEIFPNPVSTGEKVRFNSQQVFVGIEMFNISGKMISTQSMTAGQKEFNAPSPGQYIIRFEREDGSFVYTKLLVLP